MVNGRHKRECNLPQTMLALPPPALPAPPHQSSHQTQCQHPTVLLHECLDGPVASLPEPQHLMHMLNYSTEITGLRALYYPLL